MDKWKPEWNGSDQILTPEKEPPPRHAIAAGGTPADRAVADADCSDSDRSRIRFRHSCTGLGPRQCPVVSVARFAFRYMNFRCRCGDPAVILKRSVEEPVFAGPPSIRVHSLRITFCRFRCCESCRSKGAPSTRTVVLNHPGRVRAPALLMLTGRVSVAFVLAFSGSVA